MTMNRERARSGSRLHETAEPSASRPTATFGVPALGLAADGIGPNVPLWSDCFHRHSELVMGLFAHLRR